jgi:hypothetical protein
LINGEYGAVGFIVDDGVATSVLFYRKCCGAELAGVDGGDDLFGEGVVFNKLLVDWISDEHITVGDIQAMGANACARKNWDGDAR